MQSSLAAFVLAAVAMSAPGVASGDEPTRSDASRVVLGGGAGIGNGGLTGVAVLGYGWGTTTHVPAEPDSAYVPGISWIGGSGAYSTHDLHIVALGAIADADETRLTATYGRARGKSFSHTMVRAGVDVRADPELAVGVTAGASRSLGLGLFVAGSVYVYPELSGRLVLGVRVIRM